MRTQEVEDALAAEARVAELEAVRQDLLGKIVGWQEGARTDRARIVELEAQNARLRGDLEYAEAERLRLTARRDTLDTQIAALTEKTTRLKEVLVDCHAYLMRRITLLTLNESASDTTQSLAREVSVALDALADGKAAPYTADQAMRESADFSFERWQRDQKEAAP